MRGGRGPTHIRQQARQMLHTSQANAILSEWYIQTNIGMVMMARKEAWPFEKNMEMAGLQTLLLCVFLSSTVHQKKA